ncbi:hypothetical protein GYB22_00230 [bacterium]|nr:hypothetical protein [bacterium]
MFKLLKILVGLRLKKFKYRAADRAASFLTHLLIYLLAIVAMAIFSLSLLVSVAIVAGVFFNSWYVGVVVFLGLFLLIALILILLQRSALFIPIKRKIMHIWIESNYD